MNKGIKDIHKLLIADFFKNTTESELTEMVRQIQSSEIDMECQRLQADIEKCPECGRSHKKGDIITWNILPPQSI